MRPRSALGRRSEKLFLRSRARARAARAFARALGSPAFSLALGAVMKNVLRPRACSVLHVLSLTLGRRGAFMRYVYSGIGRKGIDGSSKEPDWCHSDIWRLMPKQLDTEKQAET